MAAQDDERRKLERNIHDGAQQQLVALTVKLRLAQPLVGKEPARAESMLADLQADTQSALEDLRDLARGIYPPLLADKGLAAALAVAARKSTVPATLLADGVGPLPAGDRSGRVLLVPGGAAERRQVRARRPSATVELHDDGTELGFTVTDDGLGFDPSSVGLRDRPAGHRRSARRDRRSSGGRERAGPRHRGDRTRAVTRSDRCRRERGRDGVTAPDRPKPKGFRRLERWLMGIVMGVIAFVLEKIVMRSIRRDGGTEPSPASAGTMVTTKGGEVDVEER